MKIYRTRKGIIVEQKESFYRCPETDWDTLTNRRGLYALLLAELKHLEPDPNLAECIERDLLSPIGKQELWASGVTYLRSLQAWVHSTDHAKLYERVFEADRPELFFKATANRIVGSGEAVRIRGDSKWNVPEPELTLFVCSEGTIEGYTIGNDVSALDLEAENPLYLTQAKSYDASAAIGPCLYVPDGPIDPNAIIQLEVTNHGENVFSGEISINRMKRKHTELVSYLFKETSFLYGVYLMTGTGIVPPRQFSLRKGDEIRISIDGIGTLINTVSL